MNLPGGESEAAPAADTAAEESGPMTFDKMISDKAPAPEKGEEADESEAEEESEVPSESDTEEDADSDSDSEGGEADEDELEADDPKEPKKAKSEEEDDESEDEGDASLEEVSKAAKGKTIALKLGKKEYQVPHDAKFTFEKDGKTIEFSLKEAGNNLLTSREIDQRFSKLNTEKKALEREQREVTKIRIDHEELEDSIGILREAAQTRDIYSIAQATLSLFSRGNLDVADTLFKQLIATTENVSAMDENQLKTFIQNSQIGFENTKLKREAEKLRRESERRTQKEWLVNKLKSHGIDFDEYRERYAALKELNKDRVAKGIEPTLHDKLTYEQVAEETIRYTLATRVFTKVAGVVSKIAPKGPIDDPDNLKIISAVCELTDLSFSEKDIEDIVRGALGVNAKPKVSKPKDSSREVSKAPAKPEKAPVKKEASPKPAPKGKETRKDAEEEDGPLTFDKIIERHQ